MILACICERASTAFYFASMSKNLHITIYKISSNRESEHASNCENFASTSKRAPVQFLGANRAKAKFCEHLKIVRYHLISLHIGETSQIV